MSITTLPILEWIECGVCFCNISETQYSFPEVNANALMLGYLI